MRVTFPASLGLAILVSGLAPVFAQDANPEDDPLVDEAPLAPAIQTPPKADVSPPVSSEPVVPEPSVPAAPSSTNPNATNGATDTVTVPRSVWEKLVRDVEELKRTQASAATAPAPAVPVPGTSETSSSGAEGTASAPGSRNYLLLPDISLIMQAKGLLSSDRRDTDRRQLGLSEGELGIQGYVYPNIKADAFIVGSPTENQPLQFEEGFLTYQGVTKGLNVNVGRKFAPFGRTGESHNHSYLYSRQLLPIRNLVSQEALVGDGVNLNYLLPTKSGTFARLSLGAFGGEGSTARFNTFNPTDRFEGNFPSGTGAGFGNRFYNARLWLGKSFGANNEVEIGASHARGKSSVTNLIDDGTGTSSEVNAAGRVNLTGFDVTMRRFLGNDRRLLLRSEYFIHQPQNLPTARATGYYGLANYRFDKFNDVGLLLENSGFPTAPGEREKALSLILTRQFTEQYYVRLMGTQGSRPGDSSYQQLRIQFVAGLGPHTHSLE